eukprot:TRINITY_DN5894_c0_g1_i1.p1 TRINITY_DN5894_c0_g1~~TRINITY_DN5894_c0_g1_i1.p1  ORF type:complete len:379 (+),score=38.45 TRINITY_DN5894_c0_g1_i1:84-1220(+)
MLFRRLTQRSASAIFGVPKRASSCRIARGRRSFAQIFNPDPIPLYFSDNYDIPLPESHQFPMHKYKLVRLALEAKNFGANGTRLSPAPLAKREQLLCAHDEQYVDKFLTGRLSEEEVRRIGFPWSLDLVYRTLSSCGGTLQASIDAIQNGRVAGNLSGGTHHAYRDFGSGYCVFNDIVVSALYFLKQGLVESRRGAVLVVDLDVHQGDGTAAIFEKDNRVATLSFHGKNNFPFRKQKSTIDVDLSDGATDAEYLEKLEKHLDTMIGRYRPQIIFFQAGVDPLDGDKLGKLAISRSGLSRRNQMVYFKAKSARIPVVVSLGGGYCRPIDRTVEAHADVFIDMRYVYHYSGETVTVGPSHGIKKENKNTTDDSDDFDLDD